MKCFSHFSGHLLLYPNPNPNAEHLFGALALQRSPNGKTGCLILLYIKWVQHCCASLCLVEFHFRIFRTCSTASVSCDFLSLSNLQFLLGGRKHFQLFLEFIKYHSGLVIGSCLVLFQNSPDSVPIHRG